MSKPAVISKEALVAAFACAHTVLRNLPDDYGDVSYEIEEIARAIDAAVAAEREGTRVLLEQCSDSLEAVIYEYNRRHLFPGAVEIMQAQLDTIRQRGHYHE